MNGPLRKPMSRGLDRSQGLPPHQNHRQHSSTSNLTTHSTCNPTTPASSTPGLSASHSVQQLVTEFHRFSEEWVRRFVEAGSPQQLHHIVMHAFSHLLDPKLSAHNEHGTLRSQIRDFVSANLHRRLTLSDLSHFLGYSEKYCSELFFAHMGVSFSTYLKQVRVERAKQLLIASDIPIAQISDWLGFSDQFAFSHFFKKTVGCSPRAYRQHPRFRDAQKRHPARENDTDPNTRKPRP